MKYVLLLSIGVYVLTGCSTGSRHVVEVEMDCSIVIKELRRVNSVEVTQILRSISEMGSQNDTEFISLFLKTAKSKYPTKPLREYFKTGKGMGPRATDAQVRKALYEYRSKLIAELKRQLTEELNEFGVESIEVIKGKDVLKLVCIDVPDVKHLIAQLVNSNFMRIYEVAKLEELAEISPEYLIQEKVPEHPSQSTIYGIDTNTLVNTNVLRSNDVVCSEGLILVKESALGNYLSYMNAISNKVIFIPRDSETDHDGENYFEVLPCRIPRKFSKVVTEEDVESAVHQISEIGTAEISVTMTAKGRKKFQILSEANIGKMLAITINDQIVISAPVVNQAITGGQIAISGAFNMDEAKKLANGLMVKNWRIPCSIITVKKIK